MDGQLSKADYLQIQNLVELLCKANKEQHLEAQQKRTKELGNSMEYMRLVNGYFQSEIANV